MRVRQELDATKEYLHSVSRSTSPTSEELGVTNEELQSTNEELQSTNEELQTAKEELQSTNEELETVNEELQRGNLELREANDDLVNVLASVEIAIIIVDTERRIRRFTPKARAIMKLIPGDVGRPIADLQPSVEVPGLDAAIADVIETLAVHESEVQHPDGTCYRMQIRPYRTSGAQDRRRGDRVRRHHGAARRARLRRGDRRDRADAARRGRRSAARAARRIRRSTRRSAPPARRRSARALLESASGASRRCGRASTQVVATGTGFEDLEVEYRGRAGERVLRLGARRCRRPAAALILIGDRRCHRASARLEQARDAAQRERDSFLDAVSHELRTPLSAILLWAQALRELEHGRSAAAAGDRDDRAQRARRGPARR